MNERWSCGVLRAIEGYCSETSVPVGDTLKVMVSANPVSEFDRDYYPEYRQAIGKKKMFKEGDPG